MQKGKVYLIPNIISDSTENEVISQQVRTVLLSLNYFLVENIRTARRYISSLQLGIKIEDLQFEVLDKKTRNEVLNSLMTPVVNGKNVGIISESGCPGIADPGALAVEYAHKNNIQVVPISGPSSIFMSIMASGFNGQSFVFHGYLPIDKVDLVKKIKQMELDSSRYDQTQVFMDTPYRNEKLFSFLIETCNPKTKLSIAKDITGSQEYIQTKTIGDWKRNNPRLNKIPVVFSLYTN